MNVYSHVRDCRDRATNQYHPAGQVLQKYNIEPIKLKAKEGLALINGERCVHVIMRRCAGIYKCRSMYPCVCASVYMYVSVLVNGVVRRQKYSWLYRHGKHPYTRVHVSTPTYVHFLTVSNQLGMHKVYTYTYICAYAYRHTADHIHRSRGRGAGAEYR